METFGPPSAGISEDHEATVGISMLDLVVKGRLPELEHAVVFVASHHDRADPRVIRLGVVLHRAAQRTAAQLQPPPCTPEVSSGGRSRVKHPMSNRRPWRRYGSQPGVCQLQPLVKSPSTG
jgi:hypothetical protein